MWHPPSSLSGLGGGCYKVPSVTTCGARPIQVAYVTSPVALGTLVQRSGILKINEVDLIRRFIS
ncbi:hypothetical protein JCGZ_11201 [Jatropha curcas]|uniref:Uncharacterized protein n=1 Tax=Jatropha curcas TaxID=180498 RepID=A0A067KG21_JATCU|nr:hypothetical protein JCGZ_11201 [Jatropha curcas]